MHEISTKVFSKKDFQNVCRLFSKNEPFWQLVDYLIRAYNIAFL